MCDKDAPVLHAALAEKRLGHGYNINSGVQGTIYRKTNGPSISHT